MLRGEAPNEPETALSNATLSVTRSVKFADGKEQDEGTVTVPLSTTTWNPNMAHLAIRNVTGDHVQFLTPNSANDILADFIILKMFLESGWWTFEIVARIPDGQCLFAFTLVQWMDGRQQS